MNYIPAELWLPLTHQERDTWVRQLHRDQLRAAAGRPQSRRSETIGQTGSGTWQTDGRAASA